MPMLISYFELKCFGLSKIKIKKYNNKKNG